MTIETIRDILRAKFRFKVRTWPEAPRQRSWKDWGGVKPLDAQPADPIAVPPD